MDGNEQKDTSAPGRGIPVMDIQAPRTTSSVKAEDAATPVDVAVAAPTEVVETQAAQPSVPAPAAAPETVESVTDADVAVDPLATEATVTELSEEPAAPVETPAIVAAAATGAASSESVAAPSDEETAPAETPLAVTPANAGAAKHKAPVGAIIAAIVLALVLAGATIFAYLKTKDTAQNAGTQTASQEKAQQPVTAGEVQQTASEVEASLKAIDENKDFSNTDLSDTTLGL